MREEPATGEFLGLLAAYRGGAAEAVARAEALGASLRASGGSLAALSPFALARRHAAESGLTCAEALEAAEAVGEALLRGYEAASSAAEAGFDLDTVAASLPGMVFRRIAHPDGTVTYPFVSERLRDFIGYGPEDIRANPSLFRDMTHPDDLADWNDAIGRALNRLEPLDRTRRVIARDGSVRHFRTIGCPLRLPDGGVAIDGIALDVTDEREAARRLRAVIDHVAQGILLFDRDGVLRAVNPQALEMLGLGRDEVVADRSRIEDIVLDMARRGFYGPGDAQVHLQDRLRRHIGGRPDFDDEIHAPDGRVFELRVRPLPDGGFVSSYTEVTERRRVEAELRRTGGHLRAVVDHVVQGLFLYDENQVLQVVNRQGLEMLQVPESVARPGVSTLHDIILHLAERGEYGPGDLEELTRTRAAANYGGRVIREERVNPGGREFEFILVPLPDGGIVTSYADITERKSLSRALAASEERLRSVVDNLPGMVFRRVQHPDGRIEYPFVSQSLAEQYGREPGPAGADYAFFQSSVHPDDRPRWVAAMAEAARTMAPYSVDVRDLHPDGAVKWERIIARPTSLPDGSIVWDGIALDVTTEKEAQDQSRRMAADLAERVKELACLYDCSRIAGDPSLDEAATVAGIVRRLPGALLDPASASARVRVGRHSADAGPFASTAVGYSAPVFVDGEAVGEVAIGYARWPEIGIGFAESGVAAEEAFLPEERALVDEVARQLGQAIRRRRAEVEVRAARAHMQTILDHMVQGVMLFDRDLRLVSVNRRCMELLELPEEALRPGISLAESTAYFVASGEYGSNFGDRPPADWVEQARRGEPIVYEWRTRSGRVAEIHRVPTPDGGFVTTQTDVTERRRLEAEVAHHRALLNDALESMADGFVLFDEDDRLVLCNSRYREMFPELAPLLTPGITFEDLIRFDIANRRPVSARDDPQAWLGLRMRHHREPGAPVEAEQADGRWVRLTEFRTASGAYAGLRTDITELKRRERALRESNERLNAIIESLDQGLLVYDADWRLVIANAHASRLLGLPPEVFSPGRAQREIFADMAALGEFGPDIPDIDAYWRRWPKRERMERTRPDGTVLEIRWSSIAGGGSIESFIDITERRNAERETREREAQLRAVTDNLPGYLYRRVLRPDGSVDYPLITHGITEYYGIDPAEVRADPSRLLGRMVPEDVPPWRAALERSARTLSPFVHEFRAINVDGTVRIVRSMAKPRKEPDGSVIWDGIVLDITAQREAEDEARRKDMLLADAIESIAEGFALFDPADRLVLWNSRFAAPFGRAGSAVTAGMTFEDVIRLTGRFTLPGAHPEAVEEWVARRLAFHRDPAGAFEMPVAGGGWTAVTEARTGGGNTAVLRADITTLKQREAQLADKSAQLESVLQNMAQGIAMFGGDLNLVVCNERYSELLDLPEGMMRPGMAYEEMVRFMFRRGDLGQDSGEAAIAEWMLHVRRFEPHIYEFVVGARTLEAHRAPVPGGGMVSAIADVTERVRSQAELRKLSQVVQQSPLSIVITDVWGRIEYVNPRFSEITAYARDEVVGSRARLWMPGRLSRAERRALWRALRSGEDWRGEFLNQRRDGTPYWSRELISAIRGEADGVSHYLLMGQDITEEKRVEAHLVQMSKLLTLGEMAAGITHELNQPLNIIRMAADSAVMLMDEGDVERDFLYEQLAIISGQTSRMADIIHHMRVFSRKEEAASQPFDVVSTVRQAAQLMADDLRLADVVLRVELDEDCPSVTGHAVQLEQVLVNLLANARDAITESSAPASGGGPRGEIVLGLVHDRRRRRAVVSVADTGGGIPESVLEHIFEPFFTTKEVGKGTGLGLSVAYGIVSGMGGEIQASNEVQGARFEIVLPFASGGREGPDREVQSMMETGADD